MVWSATCSRSFLRLPRSYRPDTRVGSHAVQQPHLKPERDAQHDRPIFVEVAPATLDEKMEAFRHRRSWLRVPGTECPVRFDVDGAALSGQYLAMADAVSSTSPFAATEWAFEPGSPMSGVKDDTASPPPVRRAVRRTLAARKSVAE